MADYLMRSVLDLPKQYPCVIYVRVSTEEQKEGFSISAQLELLMAYAEKMNFKVVRIFEESQSAKDSGRVQFNKMLKYLKTHPNVNKILVEKTDRLYRNFKDYAIIDDNKFEIHLVKENEVLSRESTSHQKLVHGLKVLLAKNFVDNLKEETRKGRKKKAEEGFIIGISPYGYKKVNKNEAEIVPAEAQYVKTAFECYSNGLSIAQTIRYMNTHGYVYRPKTPTISRGHLWRMLQNATYCGQIQFEDKVFEGKHEKIIDQELFDRVQLLLKRERMYLHDYIFAGLIRCERCGCVITAELRKGKYIYYHCTGNRGSADGPCKQKGMLVHEKTLYNQYLKAISKIKVSPRKEKWMKQRIMSAMKHIKFIDLDTRQELNLELEKYRKFVDTIYEDKLEGNISDELYKRKKAEFDAKIAELEKVLSGDGDQFKYTDEQAANLLFYNINHLVTLFEMGGFQVQREIARMVFSKVTLKGRLLHFEYAYPFKYFLDN